MKSNVIRLTATLCALFISLSAFAQKINVSGTVKDAAGVPVIGAAVMEAGTTNGVVTDLDGKYSISVNAGASIEVTCIGYKPLKQAAVAGTMDIVISEDAELLEETVVIGYGVQKKSDLTGAISSVGADALENRSVNDVASAISGKVAGVQVLSTSGDPGSIGTIRIRGISSNSSSSSEPLYIVDGLQVSSLDNVNPENVESIEILKDAASAAIYGAQAGNGVVVISTKAGKKGDGKVSYSGNFTIQKIGYRPKMLNAAQYIDFVTTGGLLTQQQVDEAWDGKTDTDWFKEMFPGGFSQRHTLSFQGGNDKGSFFTSLSFLDNDGIVYGDRDRMTSLDFQLNASYNIKKWLKIGTTNTFRIRSSSGRLGSMGGSDDDSIMSVAYAMDPLTPLTFKENEITEDFRNALAAGKRLVTVPSGEYVAFTDITPKGLNPLLDIYKDTESYRKNVNLNGTLYANITPFKGFTFTSRLGYAFGASNSYSFEEPWYLNPTHYETEYDFSESAGWNLRYQWENFVNYNVKIAKKHNLEAMAGMSYIQNNSVSVSGSTNALKDYKPNFRYLAYSTADANDSVGGSRSVSASLSYFARLGYNYDNRYYLQASFRADAFDSSKLSAKNRWGYFPSVSAGWTMTNEPWMKGIDKNALSFLKIRASWGINGNVGVLSGYPYASTVTVGGSQYTLGTDDTLTLASYPSRLANDDLKWETSKQTDLGIDARFLNNRLTATLDFYYKTTDDLLVSITPSYTTGQSSVYINAGSVRNKGFELELTWKDTIGDFSYSASANIASNNNLVTYLDPTITKIKGADVNNGHDATIFKQGYPVWYFEGFVWDGVDPETGFNKYKDLDGDGEITTSDMQMIGCSQPKFTYGITLTAEYKGIDLTIFGNGSQGNDIWFAATRSNTQRNIPIQFYEGAWRKPGDVTQYPALGQTVKDATYCRSSAMVYDGSYFRINQIQLGYTLPKKWLKAIKMQNIRLYASLDDFITFSKYLGFDPVTAGDNNGSGRGVDRGTYPSSKKIVFGLNVSF